MEKFHRVASKVDRKPALRFLGITAACEAPMPPLKHTKGRLLDVIEEGSLEPTEGTFLLTRP